MHPKAAARWKPAPGRRCPCLRLPCGSHGTGDPTTRGAGHPRQLFILRARSQVGERVTPLTVAMSRSVGARSTSGVSLSVNCSWSLRPARRSQSPATLKEASQACRPPRRLAGKLSPQLRASASCGKPVAPAQSRPIGIRAIPMSTPGRSHIYKTAASSDDRSAGLSPEAAFAISSTVKSAPTTAGERPGTPAGERTSSICSCERAPQSGGSHRLVLACSCAVRRQPRGVKRGNSTASPNSAFLTGRFRWDTAAATRSRTPSPSSRPTPSARCARRSGRRARLLRSWCHWLASSFPHRAACPCEDRPRSETRQTTPAPRAP